MKELYQQYCESKANVWSDSSRRSESQRLNRLWPFIDGDAPKLWDALKDYGGYSRVTYWARVSAFWDWAIESGHLQAPNPYADFKKKNPRPFRGQYKKEPCTIPFEQLMDGIRKEKRPEIRNKMIQLLEGGLRWTESHTLSDGEVLGKGGKRRRVYVPESDGPLATPAQYSAVLRACKRLGIKGPHKLRSARLSDLADNGANLFELMKFAGWSNPAVAQSYIEARDEKVQALAEKRRNAKVSGVMGVLKLMVKTVKEKVTQ
jgi:integrase